MGGVRAGTPGTAYANRTDLNQERSLPVRAAPGQTYGQRQAQVEAQRSVPMAAQPAPAPPGPAGPPQGPQAPPAAQIAPGSFGDLARRTERPTEPVTAGAALGPGPGPSAIPQTMPSGPQNANLSAMLAQIARSSGSQAIAALAQHAAAAGQ